MKPAIKFFSIFLILFYVFYVIISRKSIPSILPNPIQLNPTSTESLSNSVVQTIEWNGRKYVYVYFFVNPTEHIDLMPNFTEKITSTDIAKKYDCLSGINGGFYDTANAPLGGFMTNDEILKKPIRNRLIDGFIWSTGKRRSITLSEPPNDSEWYLQSGPLLMLNGKGTTISIGNDEYRRRSFAGVTKEQRLLFATIYNPESVYEGPLLADLPSIVSLLNQQLSFQLTDVINLDGGSASAFVSKEKTLQEFSPIGSFFCVK